jgi:hypothetical protein
VICDSDIDFLSVKDVSSKTGISHSSVLSIGIVSFKEFFRNLGHLKMDFNK